MTTAILFYLSRLSAMSETWWQFPNSNSIVHETCWLRRGTSSLTLSSRKILVIKLPVFCMHSFSQTARLFRASLPSREGPKDRSMTVIPSKGLPWLTCPYKNHTTAENTSAEARVCIAVKLVFLRQSQQTKKIHRKNLVLTAKTASLFSRDVL